MFSWTFRIAGWIIGIYALLKLAKATGTVTYTQVFQAWLDQLRDFLDLGFILKPLTQAVILPTLDLIRSFDIPIPALQDHWQQVFAVLWLLFAAVSRYSGSAPALLLVLWALLCALLTSVMVGLFPGNTTILSLGIGAFFALNPANLMGSRALPAAFTVIIWLGETAMNIVGLMSDNPLYSVVVFTCLFGLCSLLYGLLVQVQGTVVERLTAPATSTGLDITAAMLGAFGLATAFADPPLF